MTSPITVSGAPHLFAHAHFVQLQLSVTSWCPLESLDRWQGRAHGYQLGQVDYPGQLTAVEHSFSEALVVPQLF